MADNETAYKVLVQRIAEQEARVKRQELLIANMASRGASTRTAEELLETMRTALGTLRASLNHYSN